MVKNPPAMRETWVRSLGWEDSPGEGKGYPFPSQARIQNTPVFWPGEFHGLYSPWGGKESDTTEQLSLHFTFPWSVAWVGHRDHGAARPPPHTVPWIPAGLIVFGTPFVWKEPGLRRTPASESQSMWAFRPLLRNKATVIAGRPARSGHAVSGAPGGPQAGTQVHWAAYLQTVGQVQAGRRVHTAAFTP